MAPRLSGELAKWDRLQQEIGHLVMAQAHFIVFIDKEGDVDWETSSEYDKDGHADENKNNLILNDAARLETTPCDGLAVETRKHFKRLIGEAIARSLDHDYASARGALEAAEAYVAARSQETSRRWYLTASFSATLPFLLIGSIFWLARGYLIAELGEGPFWLAMSSVAGSLGALLSVIWRTGKQTFDCSAGWKLHLLEGASRIIAGAISGILVGIAVRSEIFLTALTHGGKMPAIMMLASLAAGASERLATSIISDIGMSGTRLSKAMKGEEVGDGQESTNNRQPG